MVQISMDGREWGYMLNSLQKVARGSEEIQMDLNMLASPDDTVKLYVRNFDTLQVIHELENTGDVSIEVPKRDTFVFDSEVLHSVVQQAKDRRITLKFNEHTFEVKIDSETFSGPTEFDLRLVQKSEFQEPIDVPQFKNVCELDRQELLDNLKMLSSVSKVLNFEVSNDTFKISASDKVQGSGKVSVNVDGMTEIHSVSANYPVRPIRDFLQKMDTETISIFMTKSEKLRLTSENPGRKSSILRAERL